MKKHILVSWVGHKDLWGMGQATGDEELMVRLEAVLRGKRPAEKVGLGAVKTLVSQRDFGEIHLLSQWPDDVNRRFEGWLGVHVNFRFISSERLSNPTSYEQVFDLAKGELEAVRKENPDGQLSILLSPGTPTMAAVWVLLGKTLFPATFFQTYAGKVTEESIPFDITLDLIPEYLRNPDAHFQHLAFASPGQVEGFEQIKGESKTLMLAIHRAQRAAIRDVAVLLTGESGTGKELFARAMHRANYRGRRDERFRNWQALNCAAIPATLFESELFGVAKGVATGVDKRPGAFERANGGTLFLDEVGELTPENQAKLLRALQPVPGGGPCSRLVRRVGGEEDIPCDVRVIAATNRDLIEAISKHQFRDDLFYRLGVVQIRLPALRERRSDLEILASEILREVNRDFKKVDAKHEDRNLTRDALRRLWKHNWPGNVRELHNILTQAAVFAFSSDITGADVDSAIACFKHSANESLFSRTRGDDFSLPERLAEIERAFIEDALSEAETEEEAGKLLGISQQLVNKKKKKFGLA